MTDLERIYGTLSSEPTVAFGVASAETVTEVVGPMKPRGAHYGLTYASDPETKETLTNARFPTVWFDWNKYRPDLPPWRNVREFVLADEHEGEVVEYTWVNTQHRTTATTGDLKSVSLSADGIYEGVDGAIIERDDVTEDRDYRVTEELR